MAEERSPGARDAAPSGRAAAQPGRDDGSLPRIAWGGMALGGLAAVGLVVWFAWGQMHDKGKPKKPSVQTIAVLRPPPPPPPPKPEEKPPEPKKEEVKLPDPEPEPQKAEAAPPPDAQLGVDAQGGAGGDSFGLVGKPGGRDITEIGEAGGGAGGDPYAPAKAMLGARFQEALMRNEKLRAANYRALISVWLSRGGGVDRVEVAKGTGDEQLDALIRDTLAHLPPSEQVLPADLPQPVRLTITSRGAG